MPTWITHAEAAKILGVYPVTVSKFIARGDLESHGHVGHGRGSLRRKQVQSLAKKRRLDAAELRDRLAAQAERKLAGLPTDDNESLSVPAAAEILGLTRQAVNHRCKKDLMPASMYDGRWWIRVDHLEMHLRTRNAMTAYAAPESRR